MMTSKTVKLNLICKLEVEDNHLSIGGLNTQKKKNPQELVRIVLIGVGMVNKEISILDSGYLVLRECPMMSGY